MTLNQVKFVVEWYKNLVSHTDEKSVLVEKISNLLEGRGFDSCLEIGLGISPYFARILAPKFKEYIIVEKRLMKKEMPRGIKLINNDWEKVNLKLKKFDVIIASHVIYYFKNKKKSLDKILEHLNPDGFAFIVVNGKSGDYGPLKLAFSKLVAADYKFTYDESMDLLKGKRIREYTVPSTIKFKNFEDLYQTLKISFDEWPSEYKRLKGEIIDYLKENIKSNKFVIDQKIIEIEK